MQTSQIRTSIKKRIAQLKSSELRQFIQASGGKSGGRREFLEAKWCLRFHKSSQFKRRLDALPSYLLDCETNATPHPPTQHTLNHFFKLTCQRTNKEKQREPVGVIIETQTGRWEALKLKPARVGSDARSANTPSAHCSPDTR